MNFNGHKPDASEKGVRFGCGALMGGALAFGGGFQFGVAGGDTWIILTVVAALLFGFLPLPMAIAFGMHFLVYFAGGNSGVS